MDAFLVGFNDYKDKVARAHSQLGLSEISVVKGVPKREEEKEVTEEDTIEVEESIATEEPGPGATASINPKEPTILPKADT